MSKYKAGKAVTMKEFCQEFGIDYEVMVIKRKIINAIRAHCKAHKISQRKLARMVPKMSQDRISDMYNGFGAGITIDKLVSVATALKIEVKITAIAA